MIFEQGYSLNAETEREARIFLGVDAAAAQDVRVNHTCAEYLYPALALAESATLAAAGETGDIDLSRRFRKREATMQWASARVGMREEGEESSAWPLCSGLPLE